MTMPDVDICLITPGHVTSTPRLVKSADALAEAGYRVHVVAGAPFPPADRLDADILAGAKWGYTRVNTRTGAAVFARKVMRKIARRRLAHVQSPSAGLAARAHFAESSHLASAAARIPARLFVGHSLPALCAVAAAANARGCAYGFDIEDFHDAETDEAIGDPVERRARSLLQSRLLPGCCPLTCSAPLIGAKYRDDYRVEARTILNVFPLSQAPLHAEAPKTITEDNPAIFYWFSQTVGAGRGLENVIRAMGKMRLPAELHLRGFASPAYSEKLRTLAREAGLRRPIRFLEPGSPNEMARLASTSDLGLSVEEGVPLNHDICLPNKIFIYLLGGIPQLLSNTTAQRVFAAEVSDAAILANLADAEKTAAQLDSFFSDPGKVTKARLSARTLARERYCWDLEKAALVGLFNGVLPHSR
jgi:hypothetical protein